MISSIIFDRYDEIGFCRSGFRAAAEHVAVLSDAHSADGVLEFLRPSGLYRQPSLRLDAAPKIKIGELAEVLARFTVRP